MQLDSNGYHIQNIRFEDLAKTYGTPLYIYDAAIIERQINALKSAFSGLDTKFKFACKALTNLSILNLVRYHGIDVDCVSIQEAELCLHVGFEPKQIQFTPSCTHFSEIEAAVALGLVINLDSLPALEQFGKTFGSAVPVSLRINPYIADGGNFKISTAHKDSKFGISCEIIEDIVAIVQKYGVQITGLHQHTGSDIKNADTFLKAAEVLFDLALKYFPNLDYLDFGGGFKVAYSDSDEKTDMEKLGKGIVSGVETFCAKYGKNLEIWFEPGKFIVSECGYLLVNANVVKSSPHRNFIGVDSGLNHLIRPMMYDAFHEIINISGHNRSEKETYDVVGNICETDTFGADRTLPLTLEGDLLVLKNAGAYGFSMASNYNARFKPAEVLIRNGSVSLIRKRETMEDIYKNQILIDLD